MRAKNFHPASRSAVSPNQRSRRLTAADARLLATQVLDSFIPGAGKPEMLLAEIGGRMRAEERERRLAAAMVFGVLRHRRLLDHLIDRHLSKPGGIPPGLRTILRTGAFQILFMEGVPDRAAVYSAVELARSRFGKLAGLTNAVLRKIATDGLPVPGLTLAPDPGEDLGIRHSFPTPLVARWLGRYGLAETALLLAALNQRAPLTLRVNSARIGREEFLRLLHEGGVTAHPTSFSTQGVLVETDLPVTGIPGYAAGLFSIQDEAFQLIGDLLPAMPGLPILDAFSGLGGKATQLAQRWPKNFITASDRESGKLRPVRNETRRLGLDRLGSAAADALAPPFRPGSFGAILADVPCSGTGVIRRHPDIKWKPFDGIERLAGEQFLLLRSLAPLLAPGGHLLYATCSLEPEEGELVVDRFLAGDGDFEPVALQGQLPDALISPQGFFRSLPHRHGIDGGFAALLRKRARTGME